MLDNQTLQDKYPHLEVSVLKLSEVKKDNESFRIDSEYFKKEYLENEERIKSTQIIKNFINTKIKNVKSLKLNKSFNYLQISDIDLHNGIEYSITEIDYKDIPDRATYILQNNDVCVSTVRPNRNAVALIKNPKRLVGTSGFAVLRLASEDILPEFLYIFVKTNHFITKMMRANTASLYPAVLDSDIYKCKIPLLPMSFQLEIEKLVKDSHKALESSKALYKEAEALLYEALGLDSKNPLQSILHSNYESLPYRSKQNENFLNTESNQSPNYTIATLKESFIKTGRLDAEYYQAKYEKNEALLKNYKYGFCKLKDLIQRQSSGFAFSSDEYVDCSDLVLIRINNIKNSTLDMSNAVYLKNEAQNLSPKDKVYKGDILISMSGSIGMSCVVRDDVNAMLNQRIYKIAISCFSPDVLVVFLNSVCAKLQFERIGTGGVQTNISSSDIQNLIIPLLDFKTQEAIESKISQSFALKAKSKELLESAKQRVEEAIVSKKI